MYSSRPSSSSSALSALGWDDSPDPTHSVYTDDWAALRPGPEPELVALLPRRTAITRASADRRSRGICARPTGSATAGADAATAGPAGVLADHLTVTKRRKLF